MPDTTRQPMPGRRAQRPRTARWIVGIVTTLGAVAAGWLIYDRLLATRGPFNWDEATHALKGVLFAHNIRQGQWLALLFDSYRQVLYPPLHSLSAALFFLISAPSVQTAGLVSLVSFVLLAPVLYAAAGYLRDEDQVVAGVVAAALCLGSPMLMSFATRTMLEIPGLLFLSLTLLIYLRILRDDAHPRAYAVLGLSVAITYFARIHYGVLIFIAIAIAMILEAWLDNRSLVHPRTLYFLAALFVVFGLWFAYLPKLVSTIGWLINAPNVSDPYSLSGWLFYPQATVRLSGSLLMFGVYLLVTVISIARFGRSRRVRFLLVVFWVQLLLGLLHHNRQDRYLFPMLPPIFLLTGHLTAHVLSWRRERSTPARLSAAWLLPLALIASAGILFFSTLQQAPVRAHMNLDDVRQISRIVEDAGVSMVIGSTDMRQPSPPLLDWFLVVEAGLLKTPQAGSITQPEEERNLAGLVPRLPLPEGLADRLLSVLTRADRPNSTRTLYLGLPGRASYSQSSQGFDAYFREVYAGGSDFQSVVVITAVSGRQHYPPHYIVPTLEGVGLSLVSTTPIDDTNLRVDRTCQSTGEAKIADADDIPGKVEL